MSRMLPFYFHPRRVFIEWDHVEHVEQRLEHHYEVRACGLETSGCFRPKQPLQHYIIIEKSRWPMANAMVEATR